MIEAGMILAALALDLALGEPPAKVHPVVWMGKLVAALVRLAPKGVSGDTTDARLRSKRPEEGLPSPFAKGEGKGEGSPVSIRHIPSFSETPAPSASHGEQILDVTRIQRHPHPSPLPLREGEGTGDAAQLLYGATMPVIGLLVFALPAWLLFGYLRQASPLAYFVVGTLLLKSTFSVRGLVAASEKVRQALLQGRLELARAELGSLVSRDTTSLSEPLVVAAAVESVAENSGDSYVGPLFYFVLFGIPGALAYRVVNTFDSMVGYHGRYEYLGKASARLDDLANLVPARLAGLLLVGASLVVGKTAVPAWQAMWRYHGATESPNAGWPMSAMAGALEVSLVKVGHYSLGDAKSPLSGDKIGRANRVALAMVLLMTALAATIEVLRYAYFP